MIRILISLWFMQASGRQRAEYVRDGLVNSLCTQSAHMPHHQYTQEEIEEIIEWQCSDQYMLSVIFGDGDFQLLLETVTTKLKKG